MNKASKRIALSFIKLGQWSKSCKVGSILKKQMKIEWSESKETMLKIMFTEMT